MTRRDISLLPPSLAPFGVSRETAAELVGIGATVFDQMVVDGRMPQPRVASQKRFVWDVQELLAAGKGFHTWSVEEVRQYEAKHPLGSRARLALDIALYTGLRRQEVAILGRQHVKDGWIRITPGKTKKSSGAVVEIPMLPELAASIAATPTASASPRAPSTSFVRPIRRSKPGTNFPHLNPPCAKVREKQPNNIMKSMAFCGDGGPGGLTRSSQFQGLAKWCGRICLPVFVMLFDLSPAPSPSRRLIPHLSASAFPAWDRARHRQKR